MRHYLLTLVFIISLHMPTISHAQTSWDYGSYKWQFLNLLDMRLSQSLDMPEILNTVGIDNLMEILYDSDNIYYGYAAIARELVYSYEQDIAPIVAEKWNDHNTSHTQYYGYLHIINSPDIYKYSQRHSPVDLIYSIHNHIQIANSDDEIAAQLSRLLIVNQQYTPMDDVLVYLGLFYPDIASKTALITLQDDPSFIAPGQYFCYWSLLLGLALREDPSLLQDKDLGKYLYAVNTDYLFLCLTPEQASPIKAKYFPNLR